MTIEKTHNAIFDVIYVPRMQYGRVNESRIRVAEIAKIATFLERMENLYVAELFSEYYFEAFNEYTDITQKYQDDWSKLAASLIVMHKLKTVGIDRYYIQECYGKHNIERPPGVEYCHRLYGRTTGVYKLNFFGLTHKLTESLIEKIGFIYKFTKIGIVNNDEQ